MEIVQTLPIQRRPLTRTKKSGRSRITNGKAFVLGTDGRNPWIRRCKDIAAAHTTDLGGESVISEAQRSLIRRIAILTVQSEMLESKFAKVNGDADPRDLDLYIRASGNLRRLLQTIGLERRQRDVTPDPLQFARSYQNGSGARISLTPSAIRGSLASTSAAALKAGSAGSCSCARCSRCR
jgi:hypothetical protein